MRLTRTLLVGVMAALIAWGSAAHATELTLRFNDPEVKQIRAALDVFEQQNPGIHVKLEQSPWADVMPQTLREAAVGSGPDVMHIAFVWTKDLAAMVDGCTPLRALWHVVLPVMLPGVVATATYAFLLCWTEYLLALAFLTRPEMKTLPLGLYQFFGEDTVDWGAVMAGSAVTTLPALLLFLPLQRWLVSGLTAGSVKQ